ncbi:MAG TPA: alpha/beta hydrolase [Actinomycetota bacterium]|nr:alpha/beta hydrolase [Actinomycetota bacterium]
MTPFRAILLPGSVLPAELAYPALIRALGPDVEPAVKELEIYATLEVPADYSLDLEVAGVLREADARGWERFHFVGYSGGGAAGLALVARHPERVSSLALLEPAWAGRTGRSPTEGAVWRRYDRIEALAPNEQLPEFMRIQVRPGVVLPPPPPGDPPAWMSKRPDGIRAFLRAFRSSDLDVDALARFDRPVYFALGGLSNPDQFGEIAVRLAGVFADFRLEVFDARHHFDPPHRVEPERLAESLRELWRDAELA